MKEELKLVIFSRWFLVACIIMLLTLFGMSLPEWVVSVEWGAENRPSALQLALLPVYFGGVMLLFPFCACTVCAPMQAIEIRTGSIDLKMIRSSIRSYMFRKLSTAFVGSGLSLMLAFVIHAVFWALIAMPSQPLLYGSHEIHYQSNSIYYAWMHIANGAPILMWTASGIFLIAGIWGCVGMTVAAWMSDSLLAVSLPTFLYFLWNSSASGLLGYRLPSTSRIYNDQLTWAIAAEALIVNTIFFVILIAVYYAGLRRRVIHG